MRIAVDGEDQGAEVGLQAGPAAAAVVDARQLGRDMTVETVFGPGGRDPLVDDVDHPADGRAAEHQGRGSAHDLDTAGLSRVHRDLVVRRHRTGVDQPQTIGQHLDPRPGQATDHGSAGTRGEAGAAHARQAIDQIAERRRRGHGQLFRAQNLDRQQAGAIGYPERGPGDDDVLQPGSILRHRGLRRGLGQGRAGQGGPAARGEKQDPGGLGQAHGEHSATEEVFCYEITSQKVKVRMLRDGVRPTSCVPWATPAIMIMP